LSKKKIKAHGEKILVNTNEMNGSTFAISLLLRMEHEGLEDISLYTVLPSHITMSEGIYILHESLLKAIKLTDADPNFKSQLPYIKSKDASKIYYETFGDEKSYPIILIHPIGGNIDIWDHEIPFILKVGFKIIAYEIRGHNRSSIGKNRNFTMHDLVNDLQILVDELQIKKCTMIGHSIGGAIASIYAKKYPEKLDAIIFINSASKRIPDKDLEKHFTTREIASTKGMVALAEWTRETSKEAKNTFRDEKKWNYFKKVFTKTSVEGFVAATKALYTMPDGEEDVTLALQKSNLKLLGVVGSEDKVFVQLMKEMKKDIPELEIKVIEGFDHWLIVENPDELDKALGEFLHIVKMSI
jgi:pimeloyl-ACP methyl ester carboxylesterase